ncbi:unnamed protein product [Mycena citricolor]|uniref:Uncharacterized protein n=1 Tax=Mycena citricolor TaxID=2018698 RepID=A0AAD2HBX6_9AGAR|nr:unnamed protein product [Mycena citricolor]
MAPALHAEGLIGVVHRTLERPAIHVLAPGERERISTGAQLLHDGNEQPASPVSVQRAMLMAPMIPSSPGARLVPSRCPAGVGACRNRSNGAAACVP